MPIAHSATRLGKFRLFEGFGVEELKRVGDFVEERHCVPTTVLFSQGTQPAFLYLVEAGAVQEIGFDPQGALNINRQARAGGIVGRRSMINDLPYPATATVIEDAMLLAISVAHLRALLTIFPALRQRLRRTECVSRFLAIPLLCSFTEEELFQQLADSLEEITFPAGTTIFEEGDRADALYVIDTGRVKESAKDKNDKNWPKYFAAGSFFGRHALLNYSRRRATAQAETDVKLFRLNAYVFEWLRTRPGFKDALTRPDILAYMRKAVLFSKLSDEEIKHLAGYVGLAHHRPAQGQAGQPKYRPADILVYRGEVDPTYYVLYEGKAAVHSRDEGGRSRPPKYLSAGDPLPESEGFLFLGEPSEVTVEPMTDTNWFYLTRDDLEQFLTIRPKIRDKLLPREEVKARLEAKTFAWMEAGEVPVLYTRRHWIILAKAVIWPAMLLIIAGVLWFADQLPGLVSWLHNVSPALFLMGVLWVIWSAINWNNDWFVVTNKRVIHQEKLWLISESRVGAPLDKIQNVNSSQRFIGNLLHYGDLTVETAAAVGTLSVKFTYIPKPEKAQEAVSAQVKRGQVSEGPGMRRVARERLEASVGDDLHPVVPRPVAPTTLSTGSTPSKPGIIRQFLDLTMGRLFWMEQETGTQIIWRKHWWNLLRRSWLSALAVLVSLATLLAYLLSVQSRSTTITLILAGLLAAALGWWLWNWKDWGNDLYIVTTDGVIDTERKPLGISSKKTVTTFDKVQNVSYDISNPWATLLRYGTVILQTAGAQGRLDFPYVRHPDKVQDEIYRRLSAYREEENRKQREAQLTALPEWFSVYDRMRQP